MPLDRAVKIPLPVALPLLAVMALTALGCLAYVFLRHGRTAQVVGGLLVVASAWWAATNAPVEGKVLFAVARGHGLRIADVLAVQAALFGTALLLGPRRRGVRQPSASCGAVRSDSCDSRAGPPCCPPRHHR